MPFQVAAAAIRFFGYCLGLLLLFFTPFALGGSLASEEMFRPTPTELWVSTLSMAVPGATLVVPFRIALQRPAWAAGLLLLYCASLALSVVGSLQAAAPFSAVQALPSIIVGLNLIVFWRLRGAEGGA